MYCCQVIAHAAFARETVADAAAWTSSVDTGSCTTRSRSSRIQAAIWSLGFFGKLLGLLQQLAVLMVMLERQVTGQEGFVAELLRVEDVVYELRQ